MGLLLSAGYLRQLQLPGRVAFGAVPAKMPALEEQACYGLPELALRHPHIFERTAG